MCSEIPGPPYVVRKTGTSGAFPLHCWTKAGSCLQQRPLDGAASTERTRVLLATVCMKLLTELQGSLVSPSSSSLPTMPCEMQPYPSAVPPPPGELKVQDFPP